MKHKIDAFLEIEKKYDLYNDTIDGENYWNYIRFIVFNYDIMGHFLNYDTKDFESTRITASEWKNLVIAFSKSIFQKISAKPVDALIMLHPRRVLVDGSYQSIYTDFLEEKIKSSISVEMPKPYLYANNVSTKRLYYCFDAVLGFYLIKIYNLIFRKQQSKRISEITRDQLQKPIDEINKVYGLNLSVDKWASDAATRIPKIKYYKKIMGKLLDRYDPKVIIEVASYNTYNMAMNETAREKGIPVVELQHGVMYADHASYQYGTDKELKHLPNEILTFSDYWNSIAHLPSNSTKLIAVGFPFFESSVNKLKEKNLNRDIRTTIVFVSQHTIGKELSDIAAFLSKKLSDKEYRIIYKLHPVECEEWKEKYPNLSKSTVEVIDRKDYGIYELFAISDIQIGVYSSAIYEGLGFGLKTYIYKLGNADAMESLVERGYATFFENAKVLEEMITGEDFTNRMPALFWKPDAMNNMVKEIKEVGNLK